MLCKVYPYIYSIIHNSFDHKIDKRKDYLHSVLSLVASHKHNAPVGSSRHPRAGTCGGHVSKRDCNLGPDLDQRGVGGDR